MYRMYVMWNTIEDVIRILNKETAGRLTCCRGLYRAAICGRTARVTCELLRIPSAPIAACNRTMT